MDKKIAIVKALTVLGEAFRQKFTEATVMVYEIGLEDLTDEQIMDATKKAVKSCKFMPTCSELIELAGGDGKTRSMLAWAAFEKAMSIGPYRHVNFRDRVINATVRMLGGWTNAFDRCTTTEETRWYRIEFIKAYEMLAKSTVSDEMSRPLGGISEVTVVSGRIVGPTMIECEYVDGVASNRLRIKEN